MKRLMPANDCRFRVDASMMMGLETVTTTHANHAHHHRNAVVASADSSQSWDTGAGTVCLTKE